LIRLRHFDDLLGSRPLVGFVENQHWWIAEQRLGEPDALSQTLDNLPI